MKADVGMGAVGWLLDGGRLDDIGWLFGGVTKTAGLLKLEGLVTALLETIEIKTEDQYATCLAAWRAGPTSPSG